MANSIARPDHTFVHVGFFEDVIDMTVAEITWDDGVKTTVYTYNLPELYVMMQHFTQDS